MTNPPAMTPNCAMRRGILIWIWLVLSGLCGGCGNFYTLTAPDQVAVAGTESPVVVRLQQNDMFMVRMPAKDQPVRFRIADGVERNVHTDDHGYAATLVFAPDEPGRYLMNINMLDFEGDQVAGSANFYAWDAATPVVAVDADALPAWNADTARALNRCSQAGMEIVYLTRVAPLKHYRVHQQIDMRGYPDGPVLAWDRQFYRVERLSRYRVSVRVDQHLVSQLPQLRQMFPNLRAGICDSAIAAEAFVEAGMRAYVVGSERVPNEIPIERTDWTTLAMPQTALPGQE